MSQRRQVSDEDLIEVNGGVGMQIDLVERDNRPERDGSGADPEGEEQPSPERDRADRE